MTIRDSVCHIMLSCPQTSPNHPALYPPPLPGTHLGISVAQQRHHVPDEAPLRKELRQPRQAHHVDQECSDQVMHAAGEERLGGADYVIRAGGDAGGAAGAPSR